MPKSGNFSPAFLGSLTPATTIQKAINIVQHIHSKKYMWGLSDGNDTIRLDKEKCF